MHSKTRIDSLGYVPSAGVLRAIDLLENQYGAQLVRDSGHSTSAPMWTYKVQASGAEVAIRLNKHALSLYVRNRTLDGQLLSDRIPAEKIAKRYPGPDRPAASILKSDFLRPSGTNECLLLDLAPDDLEFVFDTYFAVCKEASSKGVGDDPLPLSDRKPPITDADTWASLLDRRAETGLAGEYIALQDELDRLRRAGCPDPERWVSHIALEDIGRGYDIETTWPGFERCIEVKSSSARDSAVYLTANECQTLRVLGAKAWLYRVHVRGAGSGEVVDRIQDPLCVLPAAALQPVVFKVESSAFAASTRAECSA